MKKQEQRHHRYLVTVFGPTKAHEVIMRTQEMYLNLVDLNTAKNHVLSSMETDPETTLDQLAITSVSYLGYTSDSEFCVVEETNGEQVEK